MRHRTCGLRQAHRRTVLSSSAQHTISKAACPLSRVEGASGAGVLLGRGRSCGAVVPFQAGPGLGDVARLRIAVVTLDEKHREDCFITLSFLRPKEIFTNVTFCPSGRHHRPSLNTLWDLQSCGG